MLNSSCTQAGPSPPAWPGSFGQVQQDNLHVCSTQSCMKGTFHQGLEWSLHELGSASVSAAVHPYLSPLGMSAWWQSSVMWLLVFAVGCSSLSARPPSRACPWPSLVFHIQAYFSQSIPHLPVDVDFALCFNYEDFSPLLHGSLQVTVHPGPFFTPGIQQAESDHYTECPLELPQVLGLHCDHVLHSTSCPVWGWNFLRFYVFQF